MKRTVLIMISIAVVIIAAAVVITLTLSDKEETVPAIKQTTSLATSMVIETTNSSSTSNVSKSSASTNLDNSIESLKNQVSILNDEVNSLKNTTTKKTLTEKRYPSTTTTKTTLTKNTYPIPNNLSYTFNLPNTGEKAILAFGVRGAPYFSYSVNKEPILLDGSKFTIQIFKTNYLTNTGVCNFEVRIDEKTYYTFTANITSGKLVIVNEKYHEIG